MLDEQLGHLGASLGGGNDQRRERTVELDVGVGAGVGAAVGLSRWFSRRAVP